MNKELLLTPVVISRNETEKVLIEGSINSVRISIAIKQADEMEKVLVDRFSRFLAQRADEFLILRRKAIKVRTCRACCSHILSCEIGPHHARIIYNLVDMQGYDISFLITNFHCEDMWKHKLVDFIIQFMEEIDSEISGMKLAVNSRARTVATTFLKQVH